MSTDTIIRAALDAGVALKFVDGKLKAVGHVDAVAAWAPRLRLRARVDSIQDSALAGVDADRALRELPFVHDDGRVVYGHRAIAAALATGPLPLRASPTIVAFGRPGGGAGRCRSSGSDALARAGVGPFEGGIGDCDVEFLVRQIDAGAVVLRIERDPAAQAYAAGR